MMMHDCGHNSLFRTPLLNKIFGFITGVICGMPQFVWAQHHNYHHSTNGNWSKYRGPLSTLTTDEYSKLSPGKQKTYRYTRNILFSPIGAFMYFIFNPRFNWLLGSIKYIHYIINTKIKNWRTPVKTISADYQSRYWANSKLYWHMFGNNIVLISAWVILSAAFGAVTFFTIYIISLSLAGAAGIIIFTIQHNFDSSYASDDKNWDYYKAALEGTSFLDFPAIANWFSADIAYHHIHHLSARIPNYNLARCHKEYSKWFAGVTRIRLKNIPNAFKFILWDTAAKKIISVKQFEQQVLVK
jgi:omega-6 fatty acid desaturase (delta-12 desaturase)